MGELLRAELAPEGLAARRGGTRCALRVLDGRPTFVMKDGTRLDLQIASRLNEEITAQARGQVEPGRGKTCRG